METAKLIDSLLSDNRVVMRLTKYLFILVIIAISLIGFVPNAISIESASEPTGLNNVTLWIYPEYDDPRLLVMLEGQISGVNAPTRIRFLVPNSAEMYSAGSIDSQGKYSGGPPDRSPSRIPGWDEISYLLQNSTFRMEYYDARISGEIEKTISYDFYTLYPISALETIVQVPASATNFSVSPQGMKTIEGNFTVYTSTYANLPIDLPLHFDINYSKSNPDTSLNNSQKASPSEGKWNTGLLVIIGIIIIVAGAGVWAIKSIKKHKEMAYSISDKRKSASKKFKHIPDKYCSKCGKPLEFPSRFCPYCRAKLDN